AFQLPPDLACVADRIWLAEPVGPQRTSGTSSRWKNTRGAAMRRRSLTGPILIILIGGAFLVYNLRPDIPLFDLLAQYWPFLLIAWGVLRLLEVLLDYYRGTVQRHGFGGGEVALIVIISCFGWGAFEASRHGIHFRPAWEAFGEHYDYTIADQKPAGQA